MAARFAASRDGLRSVEVTASSSKPRGGNLCSRSVHKRASENETSFGATES